MAKKYSSQSVNSDVSDAEGALAHVDPARASKPFPTSTPASGDPKSVKGYDKLGTGGPAHTGNPTATDNRGEGA